MLETKIDVKKTEVKETPKSVAKPAPKKVAEVKKIPKPEAKEVPKPEVKKPEVKQAPKTTTKPVPKKKPEVLDEEALHKKFKEVSGKNAIWRGAETKGYLDWKKKYSANNK